MKPHFSPYVAAGDLVFVSGQLGFDETGKIADGGIAPQTRAVLRHVEAVLHTAGIGLDDVVKALVFITRAEDFPLFNETYAAVLGDHKPARSTVVTGLAVPGALVEIEVVARRAS